MADTKQKRPDGKEDKKPFHVAVAEGLIKQLEAGTAPWQRPWEVGQTGVLPMNPTTGKRYRGINSIALMMQGRDDNRWLTYKQAEAVGAQVRKGERGTLVQYWKFDEERTKTDEQGRPIIGADGQPEKMRVKLERPKVFHAVVFNAEQMDGMPPIERKSHQWDAIERADGILKASGAQIEHKAGDRAYYRPSTDSITMPEREQFKSAANYYATALHELGHWTGHESRLDRDLANPFGSEAYAKEELRAEIASMMLGDELGIGHDPGQHAAYVKSWVKALKEDPMEILRAASDAEKIHGFVMAFEQKQIQEQDQAQQQTTQGQQQAELVNTLAVSVATVLDDPDVTFSHYQANQGTPTGLADAMRNAGLTTVHSVTGHEPGRFMEVAIDRLSPVFGLKPEDTEPLNAYLERKGLAQAFALKAEQLTASIEAQQTSTEQALAEARALEQRLRSDGNATDEQISLAKEERKSLEHQAMREDRNQRVAAWAPEQAQAAARQDLADYQAQPSAMERAYMLDDMILNAALNEHYKTEIDQAAPELLATPAVDAGVSLTAAKRGPGTEFQAGRGDTSADQAPTYINVPFKEKDKAKALGAKWDRAEQSWYVPPGVNPEPFAKWAQKPPEAATANERPPTKALAAGSDEGAPAGRVYLAVPYAERTEAKAAGAAWDKAAKSWYVGPNADSAKLERWRPENVKAQQDPAMPPREEFAEALRSMGCVVDGEHPMMDGKRHRIKVVGDTGKEHAGFYVGHLDGHPAGYIKNNRSGDELRWKSSGYAMSDEDKAKMRAEAAEKLAERAALQERTHNATADRIGQQLANLVQPAEPTAYMKAKGISTHEGALTDAGGQKTYIPATDVDGKVWTMQYIQEDGTKRFAKDSRKEGCFHAVGGLDALANAPRLVIAEGYATASTLAESLGHGTVAAFDSGNLKAVAMMLHAKYPEKPVIVAGDDDRHLPMTMGNNPGRDKAIEAAAAVGGQAVFPVFAPGEADWPADVPPITPATFRKHQAALDALDKGGMTAEQMSQAKTDLLSQAQLDALANLKRHTDFNDLATRSELGRDGALRQASAAASLADEKAGMQKQQSRSQAVDAEHQEQQPRKSARIR